MHGIPHLSPPLALAAAAAFLLGLLQGAGAGTEPALLLAGLGLALATGLAIYVRADLPARRLRPVRPPPGPRGDLYAILGVAPEAGSDEIERAFRAHAPMYLGGRAGRAALPEMIGLTLAYQTLGDPVKRAAYDRHRAARRPDAG